jgi:hypothetical protein
MVVACSGFVAFGAGGLGLLVNVVGGERRRPTSWRCQRPSFVAVLVALFYLLLGYRIILLWISSGSSRLPRRIGSLVGPCCVDKETISRCLRLSIVLCLSDNNSSALLVFSLEVKLPLGRQAHLRTVTSSFCLQCVRFPTRQICRPVADWLLVD